jgi:hypothetical protein
VVWEDISSSSFPTFSVPSRSTLEAPFATGQFAFNQLRVDPSSPVAMLLTSSVS